MGDGAWDDWRFVEPSTPTASEPDYWIVYEGLAGPEEARVRSGRVLFVTAEPRAIRSYKPAYLAQFDLVLTSQRRLRGARIIHAQTALPWHAGVRRRYPDGDSEFAHDLVTLGYDELRNAQPSKVRELSVVCSAKTDIPGQRRRLRFIEQLKEHFGERLDWFGRGIAPIEDKWDAVAPYRFHISLENSVEPNYWTEKLSDAFLGGAFPLYWGCPNLEDYFDRRAFSRLDLDDVAASIDVVERALGEGISHQREHALAQAKNLVLDEYNLFPTLVSLVRGCRDGVARTVHLRPESTFAVSTQPSLRETARRAVRRFH
jgi:hypothetical protein